MAIVIPRAERSGDSFRRGLGQGIANFIQSGSESYQKVADEKAIKGVLESLPPESTPRDILNAITKTRTYNPEVKKQAAANYIKSYELENELRKSIDANNAKLEKNRILEEKNVIQAEKNNQKIASEQAKLEKEARDVEREKQDARATLKLSGQFTPEEIEEAISNNISPVSARSLSKPAEATFEKTSDKLAAERAGTYIGEVENAAKAAQSDVIALDIQDVLAKEGATGFNKRNAAVEWLAEKKLIPPGAAEALKDPLSKTYNSVSKTLMRSFGDIVKGKVSDREFSTLRSMLAQAEDSPEAAEAMVESQRLIREIAIKENELMQQIMREYADMGKGLPSDIAYQTEKRLRPIADQLARESTNKIQSILRPGPKIPEKTKITLDSYRDQIKGKK